MVFKSGKLQQFDSPKNVYSSPKNLYCANIIGGINIYTDLHGSKFIRPENINIIDKSPIKLKVNSCCFQGKDWLLYSSVPYEINEELSLQFDENNLIEFN